MDAETGEPGDLSHEGASDKTAPEFRCGLMAGIRTCRLFRCRAVYWPPLPDPLNGSVRQVRRSFLLTAAGQFRIHTGFPLAAPDCASAPTALVTVTCRSR